MIYSIIINELLSINILTIVHKGVDYMIMDYIDNFENVVSSIFFVSFKVIVIILTILLIFSLIMLAIGCLIKSQKIKSKFLIAVPSLILGSVFFLSLPYIFVHFKIMT